MDERKHSRPPEPAPQPDRDTSAPEGNEETAPSGADATGADDRQRRKAAAALLSPAIAPAGAGALLDADPRLDDRSETEAALERAKGTPD